MGPNQIFFGDNMEVLPTLPSSSFDLIYIDPPFNTGKRRTYHRTRTVQSKDGDRVGFGGKTYSSSCVSSLSFCDTFDEFTEFLDPRLREAKRLLKPHGALFLHLDPRESHYCKILLDGIFGRDCFMNEIIWSYDYGGRSKRRWPAKHDVIFWYVRDPARYTFNFDAIDRVPYLAPKLVDAQKRAKGKTPTDVWWQTIVQTNGRERTGYPTQKPIKILNRIVRVHSNEGDRLLDFFAGSGTLGEAAYRNGRSFVLVDSNPDAISITRTRLASADPEYIEFRKVGELR
jgi:site-specific DNA-methyltransferase (adenine-specific)